MSDHPLVTIIIRCFNAAATVAAAIASARAQTYRPIEIVAVDDKSRDDTLAVLQRDAGDDLRVIACAENGGAAAARNRAIAVAGGKYLAFLDADDVWAEDKLARQMALLEANPDMVMAGCRAEVLRIIGARYASIGRGVYLAAPLLGARLLGRAILAGNAPLANLYYLLTASPGARRLKARLYHSAGADTLART